MGITLESEAVAPSLIEELFQSFSHQRLHPPVCSANAETSILDLDRGSSIDGPNQELPHLIVDGEISISVDVKWVKDVLVERTTFWSGQPFIDRELTTKGSNGAPSVIIIPVGSTPRSLQGGSDTREPGQPGSRRIWEGGGT